MKIAFFELTIHGVSRYPSRLSHVLSKHDDAHEFIFYCDHVKYNNENDALNTLPKNSIIKPIGAPTAKNILNLLKEDQPDCLVVMAQRMPDSAFVIAAKSLGIKTIMYQHGLYIPFMKREAKIFIEHLGKTIRYMRYAMAIGTMTGQGRLKTLLNYINVFVKGKPASDAFEDLNLLNTDKVLVYGDHWKEYHAEQFGYSIDQQINVGYPDLEGISELQNKKPVKNLCYIAQTLIEDGRMDWQIMVSFIESLSSIVRRHNIPLIIKLHPRSDLSLYESLQGYATFEQQDFPVCDTYIGHYSSVIIKGAFISNKLILVDFPDHEIPEYISELKSAISDYSDVVELEKVITEEFDRDIDLEKITKNLDYIKYYFDHSIEKPLTTAAYKLLG